MSSPDEGNEFRRELPITFSYGMDLKLSKLLNQLADEVPTLYFLDICVANATKLSQEAIRKDARKAELVDLLKQLDKPHNSFSYLLALSEKVSDTRGKMSNERLREQIFLDVAAMRSFFMNASIIESDEYLTNYIQELQGKPHEVMHGAYIDFLRAVNDKLGLANTVSRPNRLQKASEIIEEAVSRSIQKHHPVVLVTLACLYGNSYAKKMMKFKAEAPRFDAENALADIMIIRRFLTLKLEMETSSFEKKSRFGRHELMTDDKGLAGILQCFSGKKVRSEKLGNVHRTHTTLDLDVELMFPEIFVITGDGSDSGRISAQSAHSEADKLRKLLAQ